MTVGKEASDAQQRGVCGWLQGEKVLQLQRDVIAAALEATTASLLKMFVLG
jgi:hypothetical protein